MLFSGVLYLCLFVALMRLIQWLSRNFPHSRDAVAFVLEFVTAYFVANAIVLALSQTRSPRSSALIGAASSLALAAALHFLAHHTATHTWPLVLPFVFAAIIAFAVLRGTSAVSSAAGLAVVSGLFWAVRRHNDTPEPPSPDQGEPSEA